MKSIENFKKKECSQEVTKENLFQVCVGYSNLDTVINLIR